MLRLLVLAAVLQSALSQQYQQRTVPGVPPQTYEQNYQPPPPPPPQQQQQQQQVPLQVQQQYQPPPPQQQQQYQPPPPQQQFQQPQQQQFQAHPSHGDPQLLNPTNINQEREHIQEHMDVPIDTSKMSEQELMFHYFKMHDADNNNKLDGCELIKSLIHWHDGNEIKQRNMHEEQLAVLVDEVLTKGDANRDGFITFAEHIIRMRNDPPRAVLFGKGEERGTAYV